MDKLPYNFDARTVVKLVKLAVKIARSTDPKVVASAGTFHDTRKGAWLSGSHVWLTKDDTQRATVDGFISGLLGRSARPNEIARINKALGENASKPIPTVTEAKRARAPRRERTDGEAKAKLRERIEFWTAKLATAERDARKARKTLRSLRASERALDKKLVNVDPTTTDDATLAETLRARRG